jgi:hypothetical protein
VVLYIPQFFAGQPVRIAHGALLAAGCLCLAAGLWRARPDTARPAGGAAVPAQARVVVTAPPGGNGSRLTGS